MSNRPLSITDTSDWTIEVISFEIGQFPGPKDRPARPGRKWFLSLSDDTGQYRLNLIALDDDYPNATEEQGAQNAKEFARSMLACGWRPDGYKGTNKVAELIDRARKMVEAHQKNSQD